MTWKTMTSSVRSKRNIFSFPLLRRSRRDTNDAIHNTWPYSISKIDIKTAIAQLTWNGPKRQIVQIYVGSFYKIVIAMLWNKCNFISGTSQPSCYQIPEQSLNPVAKTRFKLCFLHNTLKGRYACAVTRKESSKEVVCEEWNLNLNTYEESCVLSKHAHA